MVFSGLIDLIFPKVCTSCGISLYKNEVLLCTTCRHEISECKWKNPKDNLITDKLKGRVRLSYADALLYFEKGNKTQDLLHDLKYRNQKEISTYLGNWHAENLRNHTWAKAIDCIVPVPLHSKRLRQRGYNQVQGYAKALSKVLKCEYVDRLLYRKHYSRTQVFKNRLARTEVIEHNFYIKPGKDYCGKHIALVDDLITTGATAEACFLQLSKIENVRLSFLVMAVAA
jgi:ComF family protein